MQGLVFPRWRPDVRLQLDRFRRQPLSIGGGARRAPAFRVLLLTVGVALGSAAAASAAVTANVVATELQVNGDGADDIISLRLLAGDATKLEVLDHGAGVTGSPFDLATFNTIVVNGGNGGDTITIDDVNGPFTTLKATTLNGGDGNDTINGGLGAETLNGDAGNDTLTGGKGNDAHNGGAGDDTAIWRPGDGNDPVDGGADNDTMLFIGAGGNDVVTVTPGPVAGRFTLFRQPGNVTMDIATTEITHIQTLAGDDTVTGAVGLAPLTKLVVDGGDGNDTLTGGDSDDVLNGEGGNDILVGLAGADTLNGGDGDDTMTGGPGADAHNGGPGNDLAIWNNGDGSDPVDGGDGIDTLQFNGAAGADVMIASVNGARVLFFRQAGNINMDIGPTTEQLNIFSLAGNDDITIGPGLAGKIGISVDSGIGDDTIRTIASTNVTVSGGDGNDSLTFDAQNQVIAQVGNTVAVGGVTRLTHSLVETLNFINTVGGAPTLTVTAPTADAAVTLDASFISLAGTASDDTAVQPITWSNDRGGSGKANGSTNWTATDIPLQGGVNVITVQTTDASGNTAADTITVTVGALTYMLAEGSTGPFFDTDILLANPHAVEAPVQITYLKNDSSTITQNLTLAPTSRTTILVDTLAGLEGTELSATVTSLAGLPIVVERTMRWDATGYGAHTEKATAGPAPTWYFAEGSQGFFDTFVLLANPGSTPSQATIEFLREGQAPLTRTFDVAPTSRRTIWVNDIPEMRNSSFGRTVTFTQPGVAERAMYFGPAFAAGHESAGVTTPSTTWYLAEGATGSFFTTFVLMSNPGDTAANVTVTYLPQNGVPVVRTKQVGPKQRATVNIQTEDASLANVAVATRVVSDVPLLVERAQYWPFDPAQWYEAHNSFGANAVGSKWGLAEGRVGGAAEYQTYILLANPSAAEASQVRITFLRTNGTTVVKTFTVAPTSRFNVQVNGMVPELVNESFGAVIEVTDGADIIVERALYSNANGVVFAAGTNALATRLP
jgi:Ca2+-binding RTX toxin-like protein